MYSLISVGIPPLPHVTSYSRCRVIRRISRYTRSGTYLKTRNESRVQYTVFLYVFGRVCAGAVWNDDERVKYRFDFFFFLLPLSYFTISKYAPLLARNRGGYFRANITSTCLTVHRTWMRVWSGARISKRRVRHAIDRAIAGVSEGVNATVVSRCSLAKRAANAVGRVRVA